VVLGQVDLLAVDPRNAKPSNGFVPVSTNNFKNTRKLS
jgi:hypothetical protein